MHNLPAHVDVLSTGVAYVSNYQIIDDYGPVPASTVAYLLAARVVGVAVVLAGVALTRRKPASQPALGAAYPRIAASWAACGS